MDTDSTATNPINTDILRKAGLTESQAKGYLALIQHGTLSPTELAQHTNESRTNGYMICEKLEKLGLAERKTNQKNIYFPTSPQNLKKLVLAQQRKLRLANDELAGLLPTLQSQFNLISDEASITTLEGTAGIKALYADILREGHNLSIIPSQYDRIDPAVSAEIDHQIAKQHEQGLKARVILTDLTKEVASDLLQKKIYTRANSLSSPAQFIMYGDTVAISTFRHGMLTTVINHPEIAASFQAIFETMWRTGNDPLQ